MKKKRRSQKKGLAQKQRKSFSNGGQNQSKKIKKEPSPGEKKTKGRKKRYVEDC